jgi:AcrR family transcriptional regulator
VRTVAVPTAVSKGDRTRRRLLELAVRRFAADGYRRTSVSDIARDADLTPAAVYAYFANKEALFQAAVDVDADALIDEARAAIAGKSVLESVPAVLVTLVGRIDAYPLARRVLSGQEPEVIDRLLDLPSLTAFTEEIAAALSDAQGAGEVRVDTDPAVIAIGLETIVLMLLMGTVQTRQPVDSRRARGALAVLDAALRPVRA